MGSRVTNVPVIKLYVILFIARILQSIFFSASTEYHSLIIYFIGMLIIAFFMRSNNLGMCDIGFPMIPSVAFKGICIAVAVSFLSIGSVMVVEKIFLPNLGRTTMINWLTEIYCSDSANSVSESGIKNFILWALIGICACIFRALFLEAFFRGITYEHFRRKVGFWTVNIIQTVLFTLWMCATPIKQIINQPSKLKIGLVILALFMLNALICAFKLGLIRKVTNAAWVTFADYMIINAFNTFIHMSNGSEMFLLYYRTIAIQVVGLVIYGVIYFVNWRKIKTEMQ